MDIRPSPKLPIPLQRIISCGQTHGASGLFARKNIGSKRKSATCREVSLLLMSVLIKYCVFPFYVRVEFFHSFRILFDLEFRMGRMTCVAGRIIYPKFGSVPGVNWADPFSYKLITIHNHRFSVISYFVNYIHTGRLNKKALSEGTTALLLPSRPRPDFLLP